MGGACSTHEENENELRTFFSDNLKGIDTNEKVMLERLLQI
jgi:hypothetical protein